MKPEEKAWWTDRMTKARTGFYTPPAVGVDTLVLPGVNGGPLFFGTGADATNGTVYVLSKDMPSILKLVPAGESTAANSGGMIPSHPRNSCYKADRVFRPPSNWGAPCMNSVARCATARN